jgi:hypothetical protein
MSYHCEHVFPFFLVHSFLCPSSSQKESVSQFKLNPLCGCPCSLLPSYLRPWGMCTSTLRTRRDALTSYLYRMRCSAARYTRHLDRWLSPDLRVQSMALLYTYIAHILSHHHQKHIAIGCCFTQSTDTIPRLVCSGCVHSCSFQPSF